LASIDSSPGRTKFGEDPAAYDFARPAYPDELFSWLKQRCSINSQSICLDIGAGTGLATLPILETPVASILALEPGAALASQLASKTSDPRLSIVVKRFEDTQLPPAQFDFVFSATAFHWLPRMKSLARVLAALKPGGWIALWWSVYHDPAKPDDFDRATSHLFSGLEQDPEATSARPAFALDFNARLGELRSAGFDQVDRRLFAQTIDFAPERLAALYATFSRVRMAPLETRERLLSEMKRIAREDFNGSVKREIATSAFVGRKPAPDL
jgi:SAM-dependent methyltransferase